MILVVCCLTVVDVVYVDVVVVPSVAMGLAKQW